MSFQTINQNALTHDSCYRQNLMNDTRDGTLERLLPGAYDESPDVLWQLTWFR